MRTIPSLALALCTAALLLAGCGSPAPRPATAGSDRPARATPAATAVPDPAAIQNAQWAEFLRYGPELTGLVTKSDEIDRIHTNGAQIVTTATRGQFYNLTNQAAEQTGTLKRQSTQVRVPQEARAFKDMVTRTLSQREETYNKLKESLDRPSAGTEGAYQTAKQQANGTAVRTVATLFSLCESMGATIEECRQATGLAAAE